MSGSVPGGVSAKVGKSRALVAASELFHSQAALHGVSLDSSWWFDVWGTRFPLFCLPLLCFRPFQGSCETSFFPFSLYCAFPGGSVCWREVSGQGRVVV